MSKDRTIKTVNGEVIHQQHPSDGSNLLVQYTSQFHNPNICFGPLSTSLRDLFSRGFYISAAFTDAQRRSDRKVKVHLTDGMMKFSLGKHRVKDLLNKQSLSAFIKSDKRFNQTTVYQQTKDENPHTIKIGNSTLAQIIANKLPLAQIFNKDAIPEDQIPNT